MFALFNYNLNMLDLERKPRPIPISITQFATTLKQIGGVEEVILHGSSVSGTFRKGSDWDLAVIGRGVTASDIDDYLRRIGVSIERVGELNVHVMVFGRAAIELFLNEGRGTGHPETARLISNMLYWGIRL